MWYYIKQAIVPFFYLIFGTIIALGILVIDDNLIWLKVALLVLNLALYLFIVGAASFKDGETALKISNADKISAQSFFIAIHTTLLSANYIILFVAD